MKLYEAKESYFELYKLKNHITNEKLAVQQLRKFIAYLDEVGLKERIVKCVEQIETPDSL